MGGPGAIVWTLVALAAAMPELKVVDAAGCVDPAALAREVALRLPAEWVGDDAPPLALALRVKERSEGAPEVLSLSLRTLDRGEVLIERAVAISAADCPALPQLVAAIVARRLDGLPLSAWSKARPPPEAPPRALPARSLMLSAGVETGLDARALAGRLGLDGLLGRPGGLALALHLSLLSARPVGVGGGEARLTTALLGAGLARPIHSGRLSWIPALRAVAGLVVARGRGLPSARTGLAPTVRLGASLGLQTRGGLGLQLGLDAAVLRARVTDEASGDAATEPALRGWLAVGYAWASDFF